MIGLIKVVGFEIDDDMLGTTGKRKIQTVHLEKNSSGDLDLNTDTTKVSKEEIISKIDSLVKTMIADEDIMNVGRKKEDGYCKRRTMIHFRTPTKVIP